PTALPHHLAQPGQIRPPLVPADADDRATITAPAAVAGHGAGRGLCENSVFGGGDFELRDRKAVVDADHVRWGRAVIGLVPHSEAAGRDRHHAGPLAAVAEFAGKGPL